MLSTRFSAKPLNYAYIEIEPHKHGSCSLGWLNTIAQGTFILFIHSIYLKYLFYLERDVYLPV